MCILAAMWGTAAAQICRLSVGGLNRNRRVMGPVNTECPGGRHSAPFGNWGATSNFGEKQDGRQFEGWCHDSEIVDNSGRRSIECRDRWYEWNSCTDHPDFRAENCTLYNSADCKSQVTVTGVNVLGTVDRLIPVGCPADRDNDGVADSGGCSEVGRFTSVINFMTLYELDPLSPDQLVQSLHYPPIEIDVPCNPAGCDPAGSQWYEPSSYSDPDTPIVFAEMAVAVNFGRFEDPDGSCSQLPWRATGTSAASYAGNRVAADSLVSIFGRNMAPGTAFAEALPLPETLGGVSVDIVDSAGIRRRAGLIYVSPRQINLAAPAGLANGPARAFIVRSDGQPNSAADVMVELTAPGIFAADATGSGVAASVAVRVKPDGSQLPESVFECASGQCAALELDPGADRMFLMLFGTGLRGQSSQAAVSVHIGGVPAEVLYAGPQSEFAGLDQINVWIPVGLQGEQAIDLEVDGVAANRVSIRLR